MGCPLTWVSKLQTQIALRTMEAEYIALSQSMRELIALREILREIQTFVISSKIKPIRFLAHAKAFTLDSIPQSIVHKDNESCLNITTMPKMPPTTKHIALHHHLFRSKADELEI